MENLALIESWLYIPIAPESLNSVAWSISNEAFFYALFPFLLFAIIARSQHFSRSVLLKIAVGVWFIQFLISQIPQATLDIFLFYYFPPARLADFVIGMLVGLYFLRLPAATPVLNKWSATIRETIMFTALPVFSAALWMVPLRYQFSLVITPFLAVLIYTFARQLGEISTILSSRIPVYLGEASFAFYMVHLTVLNYFSFIDGHPASYLTRTLIATISLAISIVLSILLHERIEKPARRAILAYASHKERVVSTRAAAGERSTI